MIAELRAKYTLTVTHNARERSICFAMRKVSSGQRTSNFSATKKIKSRRTYKLRDGRIGIARYKGRTMFGKSSEDWIGLVIEVGKGEHDGTVQGKSYFKCRDGKGVMVRPFEIVEYLGSSTKMLEKSVIKAAEQEIKRNSKQKQKNNSNNGDTDGEYVEDHSDTLLTEKSYNPVSFLNRNKGKKVQKKARHYEV